MISEGMFRGVVRAIHFVGIGGAGMNGIAEVLLNLGFTVTGSDLKAGAAVARLRELGATIAIGHAPENLGSADVVVRSTAVGEENPEVRAAHERLIPVIPRAEMLAELMRMKQGIAVAGTHGKTTTTSMLATVLAGCGLDPTIVIGGKLDAIGANARLGQGDFLVAEADESDGSFMLLAPTVGIITNIDPEHMEHYGSFDRLVATFVDFANKVPFYGFTVACLDHPVVQEILPQLRKRVLTYGVSRQAAVRAVDIRFEETRSHFRVLRGGEELGEVELGMPGHHNVLNALAAFACAHELGLQPDAIRESLHGFAGVNRRFTVRGEAGGVTVVDDYGHHPVEIRATLEGARAGWGAQRRLVAVFQPHRYSRVRDLLSDFCRSFNAADHVVVCPVYAAGEAPIEGLDTRAIADGLRAHGHRSVSEAENLDAALAHLAAEVLDGDMVITLGAGNVNSLCEPLLQELAARDTR